MTELRDKYLAAAENFKALEEMEKKRLFFLSLARLVTFIAGLLLAGFGFTVSTATGSFALVLSAGIFLWLLKLYSKHSSAREFFGNLVVINSNEAEAVTGNYSIFPDGGMFINPDHDFSNDIDLFGKASLFQFLNRTTTGYGREILATWLSEPLNLASDLLKRQAAIKEVAAKDEWRHRFLALEMNNNLTRGQITGLLNWMTDESGVRSSGIRKLLIIILPILTICSFLLMLTGTLSHIYFVLLLIINLFYVSTGLGRTNKIHEEVSGKYNLLSSFKSLLKAIENEEFSSEIFLDIKRNVSGKKMSASEAVRKLSRLIQSFDSRMNVVAGFFLNGFLLWDYQCISRLEKWKSKYRSHFPDWLNMLGQVDAFISLGNYTYNNVQFAFPVISNDGTIFSAKQLGHQLIASDVRVCNDFSIPEQGSVCIITGANMAGKSTFLRTFSINYILAMTGAPVCALEMYFTPMNLFTSMRTTDSLASNESYFYAELKRLRTLKNRIADGQKLVFVLDEILKGTNSDDKSSGSKLFMKRLVQLGGTGIIATHDTSLGDLETEFPEYITNRCFEIELEGENIIFDYILREGITKKKNAVLLMRQLGILD